MRFKVTFFALSAALIGCSPQGPAGEGPKPTRVEGEGGAKPAGPAPGVQDDGSVVSAVDWFEGSFEEALALAEKEKKIVFVKVGAYWCPPCHQLDEETFTDPSFGEYLEQDYVAVHVDAEKGEGPEFVERYNVLAYPTLLVLEPSGVERGRLVDFLSPDEMRTGLDRIARGQNVLEELEAKVMANPDDLEAKYELAHASALVAHRTKAEKLFDIVLAADPDDEKGLASKVLYDRALFITAKMDGDREAAIEEFEALQKKYPDSKPALRAYRQIGRQLNDLGRPDEAIARLDEMVAKDPENASLKSSYGWFAFRQKCRPDAALKVVLQGIEAEPESANFRYLEAELRSQLGEHAEALTAIKKASELEPKSAYYKRQVRRFEAAVAG